MAKVEYIKCMSASELDTIDEKEPNKVSEKVNNWMIGRQKSSKASVAVLSVSIFALALNAPYILTFLAILSSVVVMHEFGHYIAAKMFKIDVHQFALGFGPVLAEKQFKETSYQIRVFPIGGFIDPDKEQMKNISKWKSIVVSLGGPLINILTAWVSCIALFVMGGASHSIRGGSILAWRMTMDILGRFTTLLEDTVNVFLSVFGVESQTEIVTASTGGQIIQETIVESGLSLTIVSWIAVFSISVGAFNLIPIPPLDGFHIMSKMIDGIVNRFKPDFKFSETLIISKLASVTLAYLMVFQLAVIWIDVSSIPVTWLLILVATALLTKMFFSNFSTEDEIVST